MNDLTIARRAALLLAYAGRDVVHPEAIRDLLPVGEVKVSVGGNRRNTVTDRWRGAIKDLERAGLIGRRGPERIRIIDRDGLLAHANGEPLT